MKSIFRIDETLLGEVRKDLLRPHSFAHERVGFIAIKAAAGSDTLVLYAASYHPVPDELYIRDARVGARIGQEALRRALEFALLNSVGMFHVHIHTFGSKHLWFSEVDLREQHQFVPDFFKVRPSMPHGALVLSRNSMAGKVWINPADARPINEFNTIGQQIRITHADSNGITEF